MTNKREDVPAELFLYLTSVASLNWSLVFGDSNDEVVAHTQKDATPRKRGEVEAD